MMRKTTQMFVTTLFALAILAQVRTASAAGVLDEYFSSEEFPVEVSADVGIYDKYIWRGFRLDGDKSIQPAINLSVGPFEGGFWGNFDMQSNDTLDAAEVDGWFGIAFDLGIIDESLEIVGVSFGNTWYNFPDGDTGLAEGSHAEELYLGISVDTFLSPSFTWYHDYSDEASGGADGNYFVFSIGHSFTLDEETGISLDIGEELGFNDEAIIMGDGAWSTTTLGLTIPLTDTVSVSPMVAVTVPFGDLEDANDGNQDDEFWGGVAMSFAN